MFTPKIEEDFQFDEHIFQDGLVQPPTRLLYPTFYWEPLALESFDWLPWFLRSNASTTIESQAQELAVSGGWFAWDTPWKITAGTYKSSTSKGKWSSSKPPWLWNPCLSSRVYKIVCFLSQNPAIDALSSGASHPRDSSHHLKGIDNFPNPNLHLWRLHPGARGVDHIQITKTNKYHLGGGFNYFLCSPRKWGKTSNLTSIFFRMVWFNHQPVIHSQYSLSLSLIPQFLDGTLFFRFLFCLLVLFLVADETWWGDGFRWLFHVRSAVLIDFGRFISRVLLTYFVDFVGSCLPRYFDTPAFYGWFW